MSFETKFKLLYLGDGGPGREWRSLAQLSEELDLLVLHLEACSKWKDVKLRAAISACTVRSGSLQFIARTYMYCTYYFNTESLFTANLCMFLFRYILLFKEYHIYILF